MTMILLWNAMFMFTVSNTPTSSQGILPENLLLYFHTGSLGFPEILIGADRKSYRQCLQKHLLTQFKTLKYGL